MGTAMGRYADQLTVLRRLAANRTDLRLLDLGCGIGLGTYEAIAVCAERGAAVHAVGVPPKVWKRGWP
jgi:hypothetical protein